MYFILKDFSSFLELIGKCLSGIVSAAKPLIIGLIIAYVLSPLVAFVESKVIGEIIKLPDDPKKLEKSSRRHEIIAVVLSLLIVFLAIAFLIYSFAALILGQFSLKGIQETFVSLLSEADVYQKTIEENFNIKLPEVFGESTSSAIATVSAWLSKHVSVSGIVGTVATLGGSIANFVIGIIFAIYLLIDKKFFINLWKEFISIVTPEKNERINGVLSEVNEVLTNFIKGACVDSLIIAILSSVALKVIGLEGAVVIGVFAGMANLIPYFGPIIGMIPAFLIGLVTDGPVTAILAVVLLFIIQQIDSNVIYPKVVGSQTGLRPLYVLFAITFLGYFGGVVGMLLAVPIAGVVQVFILKAVEKKRVSLENAAVEKDEE
ncbi:MAG: AI-2E family transporter [Clostridia bacterium]|nr:AI-2E family transporter [Clostridia bacterium]